MESVGIWKIKLKFQDCYANLKGIWKFKSVKLSLRTQKEQQRVAGKTKIHFYCDRILKIDFISQHIFLKKSMLKF